MTQKESQKIYHKKISYLIECFSKIGNTREVQIQEEGNECSIRQIGFSMVKRFTHGDIKEALINIWVLDAVEKS